MLSSLARHSVSCSTSGSRLWRKSHVALAAGIGAAKPSPMTTLISFDVDGTLCHSVGANANRLHKEAFAAAFREVFDLDTTIDVVPHHGSTDPLILVRVLQHHGVTKEQAVAALPALQEAMVGHFLRNSERAGEGLELLPGVTELLTRLKARGDVVVCLVTGNLQPIGWCKMEALGIKHLFTEPAFGGFGSDHCDADNTEQSWVDRAELVRIAAARARAQVPGGVITARYHVGDAPMDCQAAVAAGAVAVGVTTGIYPAAELRSVAEEAVILEGLHDWRALCTDVFNLPPL